MEGRGTKGGGGVRADWCKKARREYQKNERTIKRMSLTCGCSLLRGGQRQPSESREKGSEISLEGEWKVEVIMKFFVELYRMLYE